ncbi:MAG: hypothetical protein HY561_05420 [Gemmatimonadetes bacterium]|nr:hypothetical protein [Gemmatimonadota bacterium]
MRVRPSLLIGPLLVPLIALACSEDGLAPGDRAPAAGNYVFYGELQRPDAIQRDTLSGVLVITRATPDSLAGSWQVTGYDAGTARGFWNVDAYVLPARFTATAGTVNHRIRREDGATELSCTASYTAPSDTIGERFAVCSLERLGN